MDLRKWEVQDLDFFFKSKYDVYFYRIIEDRTCILDRI